MANIRQYIGARYIAKIYENSQDAESAEWEANVNYEPLTIVTFNNGSYISKKDVPASVGNPPTNPSYWSQTGFYNGQIASLQQQITDEISARENADNDINDRIDAISPYEKFKNKTICVIGDSISDTSVLADNWVKRLTDFMADYDCTVINEAQNGRSFASLKVELDNNTFTMPVADFYVVFIGTNYNDAWGYTTGTYPLKPAIDAVHGAIIAANSQAKYFFLSPLKKWIHADQELNDIAFMRAYLEKEFAYRGYTVLSGYNIGELSSSTKTYYMMDDIHPNANFSDILFKYVLDGMVSERSNVIVGCKKTRSITNTLGTASAITFEYDSELKVSISITAYGWEPTINTWVDLCDMPTLLEANTTPLFQASGQNTNTPQYRVQNGKLQVYFFTAPSSSVFYDYLLYSMSFATSD